LTLHVKETFAWATELTAAYQRLTDLAAPT
jgi:hypothetical protein